MPPLTSFSRSGPLLAAWAKVREILSVMSAGRLAGPATPYQLVMLTVGKPSSAKVGTSGSMLERVAVVTPKALRRPDLMCGNTAAGVAKDSCTTLASRSMTAGPLPL